MPGLIRAREMKRGGMVGLGVGLKETWCGVRYRIGKGDMVGALQLEDLLSMMGGRGVSYRRGSEISVEEWVKSSSTYLQSILYIIIRKITFRQTPHLLF